MISTSVSLIGMRELEKALSELPKAARRRPALDALREGGEPIARLARALAPSDDGNLIESIGVGTRLARSQAASKGTFADVEMHIGPGTNPQGITQEFGTYFHPAQPFMRPAWEAKKMDTLDIIGAKLWLNVEKVAAREGLKALRQTIRGRR